MRDDEDHDDDQEYADEPIAAMAETISRTTEPAAKAAQQKYDEYDDEYQA